MLYRIGEKVSAYADGRMSAKNAAAYLGLSVKTLAMKRCEGTGPAYIKQGRIFYYKDDLDSWINNSPKLTSTAMGYQIKNMEKNNA